ncbi:phosphonoacetaldehyde reductase [Acutalibacter caecimuris]|uniref:phosphonoacetaldehyde reductase n=1 Tax=Acutalibacter caecimuris TaxID=3093657 RepID=UPI002AC8E66E|nr:phosphonoacetaldehyde reductase [Acutalibacter sp. M00118]
MGQGLLANIGELDTYFRGLHIKKPFLVCGKSAQGTALYRYFEQLEAVPFNGFAPNPDYGSALQATSFFREEGCDCVVGLGGGSALDVAKCVRFWSGAGVPLIAIPTTAGTGSEATHFAVVYRDGEKTSVSDATCLPDVVLFDPSLLKTLPAYHRKASMLDALCHGMESFWSVKATEESRGYAFQAIQGVLSNMGAYLENTSAGNAGMQQAAYLAGKAINLTQTTAGHAMSYKLTTLYGIAHGHAAALCNAALWPYMDRQSGPGLYAVFCRLAKAFGCDTVEDAVAKFQSMVSGLGLGIPRPSPGDYEVLTGSVNAERLRNNPVPLDMGAISLLYHQILEGCAVWT